MTKKDKKQFDDVLKRMLGTPPQPHVEKKAKKKSVPKKERKK